MKMLKRMLVLGIIIVMGLNNMCMAQVTAGSVENVAEIIMEIYKETMLSQDAS